MAGNSLEEHRGYMFPHIKFVAILTSRYTQMCVVNICVVKNMGLLRIYMGLLRIYMRLLRIYMRYLVTQNLC